MWVNMKLIRRNEAPSHFPFKKSKVQKLGEVGIVDTFTLLCFKLQNTKISDP